jgi:hypothetical protein
MRIRHAFSCFAAAALLAAIGACSAPRSGPGSNTPNPLATADGFCTKWAENACSTAVVSACSATDAAACQDSQKAECLRRLPVGYSSEFAKQCLDAVKAAYADADLSQEELAVVRNFAEPCDKLIEGDGGDGAVCTDRTDCNTLQDLDCVKKAGEATGQCRVPDIVGGGISCVEPQKTCADGFYCDGSHCIERVAIGQPCANDDECTADARCASGSDGGTGTCVARGDVTDPCTENADCKSDICVTLAGQSTGICLSQVRLTAESTLCASLR